MKVVIVNDTSSRSNHAGCILVMKVLYLLCGQHGLNVLTHIPVGINYNLPEYKPFLNRADLVIVNGEGTIHHNRPQAKRLLNIGKEYPSVLINAVLQEMKPNILEDTLPHFKLTSFRETLSYQTARPYIDPDKIFIVPDLTFAGKQFIEKEWISTPKSPKGITDSVINSRKGIPINVGLSDYIKSLTSYTSIVTGRFHGICLASLLGIPFCAYKSNTYKNKGIMMDMCVANLYTEDLEEAQNLVPEKFPESVQAYVQKAPELIHQLFQSIESL